MDIMNQAEVISDNLCFLTYNLTIAWQTESKVRLVSHVLYRQWRACNLFLFKLRWVNFQKSMGHAGSNERASDNVRRGGCAFFKNKK